MEKVSAWERWHFSLEPMFSSQLGDWKIIVQLTQWRNDGKIILSTVVDWGKVLKNASRSGLIRYLQQCHLYYRFCNQITLEGFALFWSTKVCIMIIFFLSNHFGNITLLFIFIEYRILYICILNWKNSQKRNAIFVFQCSSAAQMYNTVQSVLCSCDHSTECIKQQCSIVT